MSVASGVVDATVYVAGLLVLDIAKLRSLLFADSDGAVALVLLTGDLITLSASSWVPSMARSSTLVRRVRPRGLAMTIRPLWPRPLSAPI